MKALCWYGKEDVRVETVPDPKIENPGEPLSRSPQQPSDLDEGPKMYITFRDKQDGCIKVVLKPQTV